MTDRVHSAGAVLFLLLTAAAARASPVESLRGLGTIIDRPPLNTGGGASDTDFIGMSGTQTFQRLADDVLLSTAQTIEPIQRITWWGFYNLNNPPATETMRVRFYGARPGDSLPDDNNIVFEESFLNPTRTATGRQVAVGVGPDELMFQVDLTTPLSLAPDTPYWLEIVQVGDLDVAFRWEFSGLGANGLSFINPITVDWRFTPDIDNAFHLSTVPEPGTCVLFVIATLLIARSRTKNPRHRRRSKT